MFVRHCTELCSQQRHCMFHNTTGTCSKIILSWYMVWAAGLCITLAAQGLCYWSFIQFHQLHKSWNRSDCTWGSLTYRLLHIKELYYQNHTHSFSYSLEMLTLIQQAFSEHEYQIGHHKTSASSWSLCFIQSLKGQGTWKCMGNAGSIPSVTCSAFWPIHTTQATLRYRYFRNTLLPSAMNNRRATVHRDQEQAWVCSLLITVLD